MLPKGGKGKGGKGAPKQTKGGLEMFLEEQAELNKFKPSQGPRGPQLRVGPDLLSEDDVYPTAMSKKGFVAGDIVSAKACKYFLAGYCLFGEDCGFIHPRNVNRAPIVRLFSKKDQKEYWDLTLDQFRQVVQPNGALIGQVTSNVKKYGQAWRQLCTHHFGGKGCNSGVICMYVHADSQRLGPGRTAPGSHPESPISSSSFSQHPPAMPPKPVVPPGATVIRLPAANVWPTLAPKEPPGIVVGAVCPAFTEGYCATEASCPFIHPIEAYQPAMVRIVLVNDAREHWDLPIGQLQSLAKPSVALGDTIQLLKSRGQARRVLCAGFVGSNGHCAQHAACSFVHVLPSALGRPQVAGSRTPGRTAQPQQQTVAAIPMPDIPTKPVTPTPVPVPSSPLPDRVYVPPPPPPPSVVEAPPSPTPQVSAAPAPVTPTAPAPAVAPAPAATAPGAAPSAAAPPERKWPVTVTCGTRKKRFVFREQDGWEEWFGSSSPIAVWVGEQCPGNWNASYMSGIELHDSSDFEAYKCDAAIAFGSGATEFPAILIVE